MWATWGPFDECFFCREKFTTLIQKKGFSGVFWRFPVIASPKPKGKRGKRGKGEKEEKGEGGERKGGEGWRGKRGGGGGLTENGFGCKKPPKSGSIKQLRVATKTPQGAPLGIPGLKKEPD